MNKIIISALYVCAFFIFCAVMPQQVQSAENEVVIAIVTGLTGSTATWGNQTLNMAKLIEEEITAAGGVKTKSGNIKVVFKYYDSESNPQVGSSVTERAIGDGAKFVLAGPQSSVGFTSSELCERAGILFVDFSNTTDKLSERGFKYFFRINAPNGMAVKNSINYLLYQEKKTGVKLKNVAIFSEDNVTGRSKGDMYAKHIPEMAPHWKVVNTVYFPANTKNFTIWLNDFKGKGVDALLGDQYPTTAILVARQCREIDYNPMTIHGVHGGWYDPEYGQNLQWMAIGTTDTCYFSPFSKIQGLSNLNEKYKKKYGGDIPQNAANIACGLTLVKDVVQRAGSIDVQALREAMVKTNLTRKEYKEGDWWYIKTYDVAFDQTGQNIKANNITSVWTTPTKMEPVYPEEFATATAQWPKLTWKELEKKYEKEFPIGK
jgi:branched-chain amino acid transport system substrate-binding protein